MGPVSFAIQTTDGSARSGQLSTPHGSMQTPGFFPVGTHGAVRGIAPDELRAVGVEGVLANTYHLHLRPGEELIRDGKIAAFTVAGGQGTRREIDNPAMVDWIAGVAPGCRWVTSVCTGVFLLLKAGPARGKRVTTHWGSIERLRDAEGVGEVLDDVRFVRDGNLVSSAGVSAGIDMALWLVGEMFDPAFARRVQKQIEYYPAAPYTAEV